MGCHSQIVHYSTLLFQEVKTSTLLSRKFSIACIQIKVSKQAGIIIAFHDQRLTMAADNFRVQLSSLTFEDEDTIRTGVNELVLKYFSFYLTAVVSAISKESFKYTIHL